MRFTLIFVAACGGASDAAIDAATSDGAGPPALPAGLTRWLTGNDKPAFPPVNLREMS